MTETLDSFLEHFGVKGMRWGQRSSRGGYIGKESAQKQRTDNSEDHTTSRELKTHKVSTLSNNELQSLNSRLQLEKTYKELTQQTSKLDKGQKKVNRILSVANTGQQLYNLYNSPMFKAGKKLIQEASKTK